MGDNRAARDAEGATGQSQEVTRAWALLQTEMVETAGSHMAELLAYTRSLLGAKVKPARAEQHNLAIRSVVQLLARWLRSPALPLHVEVLQPLVLLFDRHQSQFYQDYGNILTRITHYYNHHPHHASPSGEEPRSKRKPARKTAVPNVLAQNVGDFHAARGYEAALARIEAGCALACLPPLLRLLVLSKPNLPGPLLAVLVRRALDAGLARLTRCLDDSNALKQLTRVEWEESLLALHRVVPESPATQDRLEHFRLDFAWQLLQSAVLDKKTLGLKLINDVIDRVQPHTRILKNNYIKRLTPPALLQWVQQTHVLEYLLRRNTHWELLRLGESLLTFCVAQQPLAPPQVEALWAWCVSGDDHAARVVSELLLKLTLKLRPPALTQLTGLLARVPLADYSVQFLCLVQDFTRQALISLVNPRQIYLKPLCLPILTTPRPTSPTGRPTRRSQRPALRAAHFVDGLCTPAAPARDGRHAPRRPRPAVPSPHHHASPTSFHAARQNTTRSFCDHAAPEKADDPHDARTRRTG